MAVKRDHQLSNELAPCSPSSRLCRFANFITVFAFTKLTAAPRAIMTLPASSKSTVTLAETPCTRWDRVRARQLWWIQLILFVICWSRWCCCFFCKKWSSSDFLEFVTQRMIFKISHHSPFPIVLEIAQFSPWHRSSAIIILSANG